MNFSTSSLSLFLFFAFYFSFTSAFRVLFYSTSVASDWWVLRISTLESFFTTSSFFFIFLFQRQGAPEARATQKTALATTTAFYIWHLFLFLVLVGLGDDWEAADDISISFSSSHSSGALERRTISLSPKTKRDQTRQQNSRYNFDL